MAEAAAAPAEAAAAAGATPAMTADDALDSTLWDLAEGLRLLSVILYPFIPATAAAIRQSLGLHPSAAAAPSGSFSGADPSWDEARWGLLPDGLTVVTASPLFPRIEE